MSEDIVSAIEAFRAEHKVSPEAQHRLTEKPRFEYYGKEVWEAAATALLCGENLLLVGPKATGKNVLAECLGRRLRPPELGHILLYKHRRGVPHRHGHLHRRRGQLPPGPHHQVRQARRLRHPGRDQHGEERVPRRAARDAGLPPHNRRAGLRPHRHGRGHALHRHDELRLRRHARAQ